MTRSQILDPSETAIDKLSSDDIRKFLKEGKIEVMGLEITSDMLKVSKTFKKEYTNHKQFATHSNNSVSVMLDKVLTEELLSIGYSREVTNRIQRLRKTSGISIEDQIEIFYKLDGSANAESQLGLVLSEHSEKIAKATKMAFAHLDKHQGRGALIGETEFTIPDKEDEKVKLYIYLATPKFDMEAMKSDFDQFND